MCRILEHSTHFVSPGGRPPPADGITHWEFGLVEGSEQGHRAGSLDLTGILLIKAVVDVGPSSHKRAHSRRSPKKELRGQRTS
jgi:hypothetical protein